MKVNLKLNYKINLGYGYQSKKFKVIYKNLNQII